MKKMVFSISIIFLALSSGMTARADIFYPEADTMRVLDAQGAPGDTVAVTIKMTNPTYSVGGISHRIAYDETILDVDTIVCEDRGCNLEHSVNNLSEPGVIWIAAISMELNRIPRGSGPVMIISFVIRETAPNTVTSIDFENLAFYNNAWSDSSGNNLIIPNLANGSLTISAQTGIDSDPVLPGRFELAQNYPNPFNGETKISFNLPSVGEAELCVYDLLGRKVATLFSGLAPAGRTDVEWNGRSSSGDDLVSGVYFYRITVVEGKSLTRKMTFLK